jgi:hypothetical protein
MSSFVVLIEMKIDVLKGAFDDVYGSGLNPTKFTAPEYTNRRIDTSTSNVYVHNCVFNGCTSSSNGGAILCSSSVLRLLVEQSSFISCKASNRNGGAIYFYNTASGECVLSRVCGFDCLTTNSSGGTGQLGYSYVKNNINSRNHFNDSSITHSLNGDRKSYDAFRLCNGNILCPSVNVTSIICYQYITLDCHPTSLGMCCLSYNSIVNNTASDFNIIWFSGSSSPFYIDTCNVLNNKQTSSSSGIIFAQGNLLIKDSCILGNSEEKTIFYAYTSSSITVSNCTFDNNRCVGNVTFINTIKSSFINPLSHIATERCDSYFDSYGTLTVKISVPSRSPRCLMSCNCNYSFIIFSYYMLSLICVILQ